MVPVQGDSRWCLWKGPTCSWGCVKALQQEKASSPLDLVPWLILGQSKQAQSLQPLRSRTAFPQHFAVKKKNQKGRMCFHPYSFESTARHSTPSLILSVAKAEKSLKTIVHTITVCCSCRDTWSPLSNVHACN